MTPSLHIEDKLLSAASQAAKKAAEHFIRLQHPDGFWCAELTADTTLESDYILFELWLHPPQNGVSTRT